MNVLLIMEDVINGVLILWVVTFVHAMMVIDLKLMELIV